MRISFIFLLSLLYLSGFGQEQVYYLHSHQEPEIKAFAGPDHQLNPGDSVVLGGSPSAKFGYGNYIYIWQPESGLNDATLANPTAKPEVTTNYTLWVWDGNNCSASDEVEIVINSMSVTDTESEYSVSIYPNPSHLSFNIKLSGFKGKVQLQIINSIGQTLISDELNIQNSSNKEIDVRNLDNGFYYILIQNCDTIITKALVIN